MTSTIAISSGSTVTSSSGVSTSPAESYSTILTLSTSSTASTSGFTGTSLTTATGTSTTTKRCEEMQAVDEQTSEQITVTPIDVPQKEKPKFKPTSNQGVSFPDNDKTPTITVHFGKPAEVQSVTIPLDKTPGANVEQFEVTFYSPNGKKVNDKPILSTSSPKDEKNKPAHLNSQQIPSHTPVSRVEITIVQTTNGESPKGVVLDIKACTEITTGESFLHFDILSCNLFYKKFQGTTIYTSTITATTPLTGTSQSSGTTQLGSSSSSTPTGQTVSTVSTLITGTTASTKPSNGSLSTTHIPTGTTTKRCEEMQAVDEQTSKQITVTPTDVPQKEKLEFQPTSDQGVSFPDNEKSPTITVHFGKPAEVQSVTIPRDKTPSANVEQFAVTFYSPNGEKVNNKPIFSTSSPKDNKNKPAHLMSHEIPSHTPVSRVEITVVNTTNGESPKGVILDIKACTEITTGEYFLHCSCNL
jgi:hypothetical protein